jgi:hypothetical protein
MPIDASIPLQAKGVQLESPANQLAMMGNVMKIGEMNRGIEEQNKLNEYLRSGADLGSAEGKRGLLNYGKTGITYGKAVSEMEKAGLETKKLGVEISLKDMEVAREGYKNLLFNPSPTNFAAHLEDAVKSGKMTPQQAQQEYKTISSLSESQRLDYVKSRALKAEQYFSQQETARHNRTTEGTAAGHLNVAQQTLANANNPELQSRLAGAKKAGEEYGKATAQANIALPGAIATGEEAIRKVDELVGKAPVLDAKGKVVTPGTKPAAGFEQAVGLGIPGLKYIPGSSVADFNARLNEIQGGAFLQAFTTLKGGGSITEKEGEKATAAINRMSTAQSEKEFNIAAREYQNILRTGIDRAKAKAASGGAKGATEIDFNSLN